MAKPLQGAHERLLDEVLRGIAVAREVAGKIIGGVEVRQHEGAKANLGLAVRHGVTAHRGASRHRCRAHGIVGLAAAPNSARPQGVRRLGTPDPDLRLAFGLRTEPAAGHRSSALLPNLPPLYTWWTARGRQRSEL